MFVTRNRRFASLGTGPASLGTGLASLRTGQPVWTCVKDPSYFSMDRKFKSINLYVKNIENWSRITAARLPKVRK